MKLKHTPGPWKCYNTDAVETKLDIVIESQFSTIGWLYSEQENSEANARLIAAVPEMLEALIEASEYLHQNDHLNSIGNRSQLHRMFDGLIEKATGSKIEEIINQDKGE